MSSLVRFSDRVCEPLAKANISINVYAECAPDITMILTRQKKLAGRRCNKIWG